MPNQLNALVTKFNSLHAKKLPETYDGTVSIPCRIAGLLSDSFGKIDDDSADTTTFMEYSQFLKLVAQYLPDELNVPEFKAFLSSSDGLLNEYAD